MNDDAIAVIGMAGRFPGATDVAQFWDNLRNGVESVRFHGREELAAQGVAAELLDDPLYVPASAPLDGVELFDADFFGFTPREAELTDPQHRIFLECAWEALENSGYDAERHDGQIGIYAGAGLSTYLLGCLLRRPDVIRSAGALALQLGNNKDYVPLRVSYKLRLRGPSINVNTACSSSLVAVHLACQSLIDGQCDIALAGGVGIQVPQQHGYLYAPNGILSPDGHCRAFDADAQGTVSGNGAGIVVLKRYADAVADGDAIRAVILGSAVNNDGGNKVGFTAPSVDGQAAVIGEALAVAGIDPAALGYVEAHGTGTPMGDPIEVQALTRAFRSRTQATRYCALGSVKTNVGHLDEAAGVAGLIKAVLALEHAEIPPSLHYVRPNPALELETSPFYVPTRLAPWDGGGRPRHAAVSSFGLGGTNAHVVLQEAPPASQATPSRPWQLLPVSARTGTALDAQRARLATHLRAHPGLALADVAYTLCVGRKDFAHRAMVACSDLDSAVRALESPSSTGAPAPLAPTAPRPVVFMFPGQGTPYPGMGQGLYRSEPVYREWIDRAAQRLLPCLGFDLREALHPRPEQSDWAALRLNRTDIAQPALFAVEYALARLLESWDIRPQAMIGHSLGEYVAACLAGVWSWDDALDLIAERGRLMQRMPAGAMLAVELAEPELRPLLAPGLALALANAPSQCVIAGDPQAIDALEARLEARGAGCRRLPTSHAFHSEAMEPVLEPFVQRLRQVPLKVPAIPCVSNLTGRWLTAAEATDPHYWAQHLRRTVRFSEGIGLLLAQDDRAYVEVGPGQSLSALLRRQAGATAPPAIATMRHRHDPRDDAACLVDALGRLWLAGGWRKSGALHAGEPRRRVPLPTYPFERRRFWVDPLPDNAAAGASPAEPAVAAVPVQLPPPQRAVEDWFHVPVWRHRAARPAATGTPAEPAGWLVFVDRCGLGERIVARLRGQGQRVVELATGGRFAREGELRYTLDPHRPEDLDRVCDELADASFVPRHVVHLWSFSAAALDGTPADRWHDAQALGFHCLLRLVQSASRRDLATDLTIDVVSSRMQQVVDDDALPCPEQATLLGPVRVVPLEYPGIRCRSIDIDPVLPPAHGVDLLLAELQRPATTATTATTPVLAMRDGTLWEQAFAPLRLAAPVEAPARLRERGTYLITGGLGSMGLALARCLAREVRARLVLVGRTGLPPEAEGASGVPRQDRRDTAAHDAPIDAADAAHVRSIEDAARSEARLAGIDADSGLQQRLHAFCSALIGRYFAECGVALDNGRRCEREALQRQLGVVPRFRGFLDFLVASLAADGVIVADAERIEFIDTEVFDRLDELRRRIVADHPRFAGLLELLEGCAGRYRQALAGAVPSISVLYPDGTPAWMDACRRDVPDYACDGIYLRTAARRVADLAARPGAGTLRILEVGGGGGTLTRAVVDGLKAVPAACRVDYHFTDLGPTFVRRAQQEAVANGIDFMRFGVFDISLDPAPQGFADGSFDLVLGYNVVHAAPRLDESVAHLRRLLAPGGQVMLVETTRLRRWDEMVWGLTEGWWHFAGDPRRSTSPLIGLSAWEALMRERGFDAVAAYPQDEGARHGSDAGLIVARRPLAPAAGDKVGAAIAAVHDIRGLGGEVMVVRADVADAAQMRSALTHALERFGRIDGVIHTAGVLGQGLVHAKTRAEVDDVFSAKAQGLLVLDGLLQEHHIEPDFMMLCSSLASVAPIIGQVDYCAANAFLDAYAAYRARSGGGRTTVVSIDWGFWQELGMIEQARMPQARRQQVVDALRQSGRPGAGVDAFRRILGHDVPPQVLVTPDPLEGWLPVARPPGAVHPWFDADPVEGPGFEAWVASLEAGDWVLDEHRPLGRAVLPGTAYLELACAALALHCGGGPRPMQLDEVYFLAPLIVDDDATVELRTILKPRGAGFEFLIASRIAGGTDEWLEHARGEIALLDASPPPACEVDAVARRCLEADLRLDGDATSGPSEAAFAQRVRHFTPHWRCFERVRIGRGEGLATLRLATAFAAETASLTLHPALADMATGFLSMIDGFESGVPFGYRRVRVWRPLGAAVASHARASASSGPGERSYDATLVDPDGGHVLVEVTGFTMRELRAAADGEDTALPQAERNYCVEIERPGTLATLGLRPSRRRAPGPGEIEIEVAATGLNFIEVLYALGLLPEPAGGEVAFGLECAGQVAAVGRGVESVAPGDTVYGFAPRALGRFATTAAHAVAPVPDFLSVEQAAALPAAYTTAYYALVTRGRLRRGERVLIHAAAGGVGLAAVQVARWRGAEIYATAGTPEKRDHLRSLGIAGVWDSRTLDFAAQVLDATQGRGVDMVLNSLGGDFIAASLGVLGRYGRFLELGKRDILRNTTLGLAAFEKHLSFTAIDVGTDLPDFATVWRQVVRAIRQRALPPLPQRAFAIEHLVEAFEHMAQARHIGKVVIAAGRADAALKPRASHGRPFDDLVGRGTRTPPAPAPSLAPASPGHVRPALASTYRAPADATEAAVVSIWEELLGVPAIGVDDNFFELRGDSLLAAQVTSRLYAAFQVKLPLSSVFEHPTAAGLASRIEQLRQSARDLATAPPALSGQGEVEHEL
ncbi:type I polyketide synthase [Variovorax sp. J22R115]|uniref:type I polyketide synthase n=1 Tax=Variovorax sp. J22R115 TaxID=3053509 RepID=UPI0025754D00|nr:type I polyketide synthase [Variovorax sp. J22R115]MDM0053945.1 SDR family oxidoreductase [Variovorax sp. J22R115]